MTTASVYDFEAIKARTEQLATERKNAPTEHAMQTAVEEYLAVPKPIEHATYLGWDIYAPGNLGHHMVMDGSKTKVIRAYDLQGRLIYTSKQANG